MTDISKCCNASMTVVGDLTKHYQCDECKNPTDPAVAISIDRLDKWFKHSAIHLDTYEKFIKLLQFVKSLKKRSCCNVCRCVSCDAVTILREIGESE